MDFKPGVAYMPVPRCDSCTHWDPHDKLKIGWCNLQRTKPWATKIRAEDGAGILTNADFGCTEWEVKANDDTKELDNRPGV